MNTIQELLQLALSFCTVGVVAAESSAICPAPSAAPAEFGAERPVAREAPNVTCEHVWLVRHPRARVFPLLCPTREYDWLPGWRTQLLHSISGVAEENCLFETRTPEGGPVIWMCTRYEPPVRVEYTTFSPRGVIGRLKIQLEETGDATRMTWSRTWHAFSAEGEPWVRRWEAAAFDRLMEDLREQLEFYLEHGTARPPRR